MKKSVFILKIMTVMVLVLCALPMTVYAAEIIKPNAYIRGITSGMVIEEGGSITFRVRFEDNVEITSSNIANISFNGFTALKSIQRTTTETAIHEYTVTLSNIQGTAGGGKYVSIPEGAAKDTSENLSKAVNSNAFVIKAKTVADTTSPVTSISGITSGATRKAGDTIVLSISFADETKMGTSNLVADNITLNGFTANKIITKNQSTEKVHTYSVTLSNIQGSAGGSKSISVVGGVATDAAGNKSTGATSASFTLEAEALKDIIPPAVYIKGITTGQNVKRGGSIILTIGFTDSSLSTSDLANGLVFNGFTALRNIRRTVSTNNQHEYIVELSNIQGTLGGNKYVSINAGAARDSAGNTSKSTNSNSFVLSQETIADQIPPIVYTTGITSGMKVTKGNSITVTVTCEDGVSLATSDISGSTIKLNGFTAEISSKIISKTDKTHVYSVTFTNIQGTIGDNKYFTVEANSAVDGAGNKSKSINSNSFTLIEKVVPPVKSNPPTISISNPSPSAVYKGGTIKYIVTFADDVAVTAVDFTKTDVILNGFTATVTISGSGLKTRTVTLSNIQGTSGYGKYITVAKGVAIDADENVSKSASSPKFSILQIYTPIPVPTPIVTSCECIDDLSLLGDINKEITYFSSWLRAEKYTATYVQENNYVAENETMTYMVEYYNGSTAPAPETSFTLTIPYYVEVEEINGCGFVASRTNKETIIQWNMGKIPTGAYCRLYVRVRFTENTELKNSSNISETFYATLKTIASGNTSYSYMRQLFIDKTPGKTGTFKSYLSTLDTANLIRPDDEITRAEFAKLLADSGIVIVDNLSQDYKTFKDWEEIPVYARAAVAALVKANIVQAFPDGEFKPGNPILMEDAMQMIAQATTAMSETKLTVLKPTFLYTSSLLDRYNELSEKKDYIMELMRQNVSVKYESNPDTYALRKEIVRLVNALTFRGPFVEKLPSNALKFTDIRDDSVYFYDIVAASNSYTYTYDYRLWQEITSVNN